MQMIECGDGAGGGEPDVGALRRIAESSEAAKACFGLLAKRQRRRKELAVEVLMREALIERRQAWDFFQSLDYAGCGKAVAGRGSKHTRFRWSYTMRSVGNAALGLSDTLEPLDAGADEDAEPRYSLVAAQPAASIPAAGKPPAAATRTQMLDYPFPLRPGLKATLTLPEDLTADEAGRLANFIGALGQPAKPKGEPQAQP